MPARKRRYHAKRVYKNVCGNQYRDPNANIMRYFLRPVRWLKEQLRAAHVGGSLNFSKDRLAVALYLAKHRGGANGLGVSGAGTIAAAEFLQQRRTKRADKLRNFRTKAKRKGYTVAQYRTYRANKKGMTPAERANYERLRAMAF